jgi:hypothetical protein
MTTTDDSVRCGVCGGAGAQRSLDPEEERRGIEDVCYHCAGTGRIDEETQRHDRRARFAEQLASLVVSDMRVARDEDTEDFAFCAAENGMSERDYATTLVWDWAARFGQALDMIDVTLLDAMVDASDAEGATLESGIASVQASDPARFACEVAKIEDYACRMWLDEIGPRSEELRQLRAAQKAARKAQHDEQLRRHVARAARAEADDLPF